MTVAAAWLITMTLSTYSLPDYTSPCVCIMMEYHLKERGEKKSEWVWVVIAETEVCGLLVKVLLVGAVYDTFLVGCTTVIQPD